MLLWLFLLYPLLYLKFPVSNSDIQLYIYIYNVQNPGEGCNKDKTDTSRLHQK